MSHTCTCSEHAKISTSYRYYWCDLHKPDHATCRLLRSILTSGEHVACQDEIHDYIIICYINSAVTAIINIKCSKKKKKLTSLCLVSFPGYTGVWEWDQYNLLASAPQANAFVLTTCHQCVSICSNINADNWAYKGLTYSTNHISISHGVINSHTRMSLKSCHFSECGGIPNVEFTRFRSKEKVVSIPYHTTGRGERRTINLYIVLLAKVRTRTRGMHDIVGWTRANTCTRTKHVSSCMHMTVIRMWLRLWATEWCQKYKHMHNTRMVFGLLLLASALSNGAMEIGSAREANGKSGNGCHSLGDSACGLSCLAI